MELFDKEFDEVMAHFEKNAKDLIDSGHRMERETKETTRKLHVYYQDGYVNKMFKAYLWGYVFSLLRNR